MCAADEVWRLQRGSEKDAIFFQHAVNGGDRITDRGTRQGSWILAPSGKVLGKLNSRNVEKTLAMFQRALEAWEGLPASERRLDPQAELDPAHRWEHFLPAEGLVLQRISRELSGPTADPASERSRFWNRDVAWFHADEIKACLPGEPAVGQTVDLGFLARRLARFHLVDDVRGQTVPFAPEELREATLGATVTALEGSLLTLALAGRTRAAADGEWRLADGEWKPKNVLPHGLEARLAGRATWDRDARRFVDFELIAVARRYGRTQNNGRWRAQTPGRMAFHLVQTDTPPPVAPTFAALYGVDWIELPKTPNWRDSPEECGLDTDG